LFVAYVYSFITSIILFCLCATGFGSWIRPVGIPLLLVGLLSLLILLTRGQIQFRLWLRLAGHDELKVLSANFAKVLGSALMIFTIACSLSYFLGSHIRKRGAARKADRCSKLITALEEYKKQRGTYPNVRADLINIDAFKSLRHTESIYLGDQSTNDVDWTPSKIADANVSVFVLSNRFQLVVPIERMSPITFSSFRVFSYENDRAHWRETRLHWSLLGAYIDSE
jgi:hypothetical protein